MKPHEPRCQHDHDHVARPVAAISADAYERAAGIFRAMGDTPRLRMLHLLMHSELCVSEIVDKLGEKFSTVSQRLKLLRQEGLVVRRREGTHLYYALADQHVADLLVNALEHAQELEEPSVRSTTPEGDE